MSNNPVQVVTRSVCRRALRNALSKFAVEPFSIANRSIIARHVVGIFFPQRPLLKLDNHGYSAGILLKIITASAQVKSFKQASRVLKDIGEFYVSPKHINRLTGEIGRELQEQRDRDTEDYVHHRRTEPTKPAPVAAAVHLDGGRVMTRQAEAGVGVHGQQWKEDKVACLHELAGPTFSEDPHPQPPQCFLDAPNVDQMVRDIQAHTGKREENELPQLQELGLAGKLSSPEKPTAEPDGEEDKRLWPPKRQGRTCVATMANSAEFGKIVAAEACAQNFSAADRRALLGDGGKWIWTIQAKWFKEYTAIADFVHPLTYLYVTATVLASSVEERWQWYVNWLTMCWQGRCRDVITDLEERLQTLGGADERSPPTHPRQVLPRTITYLQNNCPRMNYAEYRKNGLPVTSSAVESLIKEFNVRIKGTEKFWNRPEGAEAILQVRAAVLSDDDRLARHIAGRPGNSFRRVGKNT